MTKDIVKSVQNCKICAKKQKHNPQDELLLCHLKNQDYLIIADAYSGYFEFVQLSNITSKSVIRAMKHWFATFGIHGGKHFQRPHFARFNGLAERYVQEAKTLLDKCLEEGSDVQLALLHHRNTPRPALGSPVQRLMSRRTKTLLPINNKRLFPKIIANVPDKLQHIKVKEKYYADNGKKNLPRYKQDKADEPRSVIVQMPEGSRYRFIKKGHSEEEPEHHENGEDSSSPPEQPSIHPHRPKPLSAAELVPSHAAEPVQQPSTSRFGRQIKKLNKLKLFTFELNT
ncbi:hypothetical protein ILUMI_20206 [Ignelater luminosus]|uniref:Integrase catalytic domain-containing protein n=1 Tax=Ignelater luminosus TaxID=2038154 RepID=A0A8K0CL21_IGNLU|nr:hypothetical protein ILUMI_20206 [Ignelater luminosus]